MGCATSAPLVNETEHLQGSKQYGIDGGNDQLERSSSNREKSFACELTELVNEAINGSKPKDVWIILCKCVDLICSTFDIKTCSIIIYTPSGLHCKISCNTGSVLNDLIQQYPDALPADALGVVTPVVTSQTSLSLKLGDEAWDSLVRESPADFSLLTGSRGGCTALAVLPLAGGLKCPGALLLGHSAPLGPMLQQSWLATLLPLLSLFLSETPLQRTLSLVERVVEAGSLSGLAFAVVSELGDVFEWCHREEVEARLVMLGAEGDTATVYSKACPPSSATAAAAAGPSFIEERNSARSGASMSLLTARSGAVSLPDESPLVVGTHMSLDNTLTKRCLSGRQRLLFVADVMQALKLYGEPWKDIFFDNAAVVTPCWVLAAPLVQEGRKLGAVIWLSSTRVNSDVLMRTASICASPIIHAITRAAALHRLGTTGLSAAGGGGGGGLPSASSGLLARLPSAAGQGLHSGGGGLGRGLSLGMGGEANGMGAAATAGAAAAAAASGGGGNQSFTRQPSSGRPSSNLSRWKLGRPAGQAGGDGDAPAGRTSLDGDPLGLGDLDCVLRKSLSDVPVKFVLRHSPSTGALMRMYRSSIAQRAAPAEEDPRSPGSVHEIRILSKAGEGAFGSVYVGRWRNQVIAAKIIKDTASGSRALKTAWELAVNKSLSHPSIVTVHAILTDVHLQKTSTRVLRFVPAAALEAQQQQAAAVVVAAVSAAPSSASASVAASAVGAIATVTCNGSNGGGGGCVAVAAETQQQAAGLTRRQGGNGLSVSSTTAGATAPTATVVAAAATALAPPQQQLQHSPSCPLPAAHSAPSATTTTTAASNGGGAAGSSTVSGAAACSGGPTDGGCGCVSQTAPGAAQQGAASPGGPAAAAGGPAAAAAGGPAAAAAGSSLAPALGRESMGGLSVGAPPPAALLKTSKPASPKVHAILMEYCSLGGLHKYIDNRMFFRDRTPLDKALDPSRNPSAPAIPLPPESLHMDFILATLSEVASALQYLHAQGFVHCDLKPENVLLKEANNRRGFTAKLADFGLSELRSSDGQVVGDLGGTVTHVAPESVMQRQVSAASDMYAFGILMWELYSGQQPYRALLAHIPKREDRHRMLLARVVHEGLRPQFPPGVPQDYWTLATQCWSADPTARPSTGEALTALEVMYGKYAPPPQQQQQQLQQLLQQQLQGNNSSDQSPA